MWKTVKMIYIKIREPEEDEREAETQPIFEETMAENFPAIMKHCNLPMQAV